MVKLFLLQNFLLLLGSWGIVGNSCVMNTDGPSSKTDVSSAPATDQKLNGDSSSQTVEDNKMGIFLMDLQSLLRKLQVSYVRADFLALKILNPDNPQGTLQLFDALNHMLTPEWHYDVEVRKRNIVTALGHVELLLSASEEIFVIKGLPGTTEYTYAAWMHGIRKLMASPYWSTGHVSSGLSNDGNVKEERPSTILQESKKASNTVAKKRVDFSSGEQSLVMGVREADSTDEDGGDWRVAPRRNRQLQSTKCRSFHTRDVPTADYGDSTSLSSEDSASSDDRCSYRRKRSRYYREVVPPEPFNMEGRMSLRKFLEDYERYFKSKFEGTQRDCTRELVRFISGELKDAYNALGGAQRKYRDMKALLLEWYRTQRVGRTHKWKAELQQAEMRINESLKLYCMRLEDLAHRAYASDERECIKQLKSQFVKTAPLDFLKHMEERERIKMALHEGKSLSWNEIVELAEWVDKKRKKAELYDEPDIIDAGVMSRLQNLRTVGTTAALGTIVTENRPARGYDNGHRKTAREVVKHCNWCGRAGHLEEDCWRKKGVCSLCGSGNHILTACPKYVARRATPHFVPKCSRCGGNHCG